MDLKGSLINTNLKIYPSKRLLNFLETIAVGDDIPINILKLVKGKDYELKKEQQKDGIVVEKLSLNNKDIENLQRIKNAVNAIENKNQSGEEAKNSPNMESNDKESSNKKTEVTKANTENVSEKNENLEEKSKGPYLITSDIEWLYSHLQSRKIKGDKNIPYLHVLLEGIHVEMPKNKTIKRNPVLEARCVKLRAQQEAREYRKMTKSVDNVRMRFPEDSISYQLKQVNKQLIAIGQFIISIFAGFLFGFRGVEWMVGNLDFGFRLLLGVMCALVIALAEIYFLAKKLNEELNIPETVQLGGPPKFVDNQYENNVSKTAITKEHQD